MVKISPKCPVFLQKADFFFAKFIKKRFFGGGEVAVNRDDFTTCPTPDDRGGNRFLLYYFRFPSRKIPAFHSRKPRVRSSCSIRSSSFSEGAQTVWKWQSSVSTFRGLSRQRISRSANSSASRALSMSSSVRMEP